MGQRLVMGSHAFINLPPNIRAEADRLFAALATLGTVSVPATCAAAAPTGW